MRREAVKLTTAGMNRASIRAMHQIKSALSIADNLTRDPEKEDRLKYSWCKNCFYTRRYVIAGQAMTHQPCGLCLHDQIYGSTATDVLCGECATVHGLCKHCGADMDYKTRVGETP